MPYDLVLEPRDKNRAFSTELITAMNDYVEQLPTYRWDDSFYLLFRNNEERERRIPQLLIDRAKRNDYLTPTIQITFNQVLLSIVVEETTDLMIYRFVKWCQDRWPCVLTYFNEVMQPEDLLELDA
jgi:hypothetical protein